MTLNQKLVNPYIPEPMRIVRRFNLIPGVRFFQIRPLSMKRALEFRYKPGQFLMLSILGVGEAPFSISSPPSRPGILELAVRKTGTLTKALYRKKENAILYVRGPYGNGFDLTKLYDKDVIVVAGGLGVIPLRSILLYMLDNRDQFRRVKFLYGAGRPGEMLFKDEFFQIEKREDLDCYYSVDKDDTGNWPYYTGLVTELFKHIGKVDPDNVSAVIVGPPIMYKYVIRELIKLKIPKHQIQLSLERRMRCGIGKCGHCALDNIYTCMDGPVFTYWDTLHFHELI